MEKVYLAVVSGVPKESAWVSRLKIGPDPMQVGKQMSDPRSGKEAETSFRVLQENDGKALVEARPVTGRTHQIRVHLAEAGYPVVGDEMYSRSMEESVPPRRTEAPAFALRAVSLTYSDPFTRRRVKIDAPRDEFAQRWLGGKLPERQAGQNATS